MKFLSGVSLVLLVVVLLLIVIMLLTYSMGLFFLVKSSPFECGFYSFGILGVPFSMMFFIVSLMFLLFDVEIMLVCFFPFVAPNLTWLFFVTWFTLCVILLATLYEWVSGVLVWV